MTTRDRWLPMVICVATLLGVQSFAQSAEPRPANSTPQSVEQLPALSANPGAIDTVANEIGLLRKSLQTLNTRLREMTEKGLATDPKQKGAAGEQQNRILLHLDLLNRAEQRAEALRKQLLELTEKETSFRTRLVQFEEEMRPDSLERATSLVGTTRAAEVRDVRRRILENERKGVESLLNQTNQSRLRLEDDVRQADALVLKLRQHVLPLIEKEIEKINPEAGGPARPPS